MKPIYRIRPLEDVKGVPMWKLEEGTKANRKRNGNGIQQGRRWQIICLAYDLDILKGVKSDIREQAIEQCNAICK